MPDPLNHLRFAALLLAAALATACTVLRAPVSPPVPTPENQYRASARGIEVEAVPIRTWEQNMLLFDDNLPAVGLLAVWVDLRDASTKALDLKHVKWELRRGNEKFPHVGLDDVFRQYYKRHHTRLYSVNADHQARQALAKWTFDDASLEPSGSRKGFLFFKARSAQSPDWTHGTVLVVNGLALEGSKGSSLELPLFHASP